MTSSVWNSDKGADVSAILLISVGTLILSITTGWWLADSPLCKFIVGQVFDMAG